MSSASHPLGHSPGIMLSLLCLCMPASPMLHAVDDYADIEMRKQKLDYLNDLLRIREAELKIEELTQQKALLQKQGTGTAAQRRDSSRIAPPSPPPARPAPPKPPRPATPSLERDARLVEIRNRTAVIEIKGKRHVLDPGMNLRGWTLREVRVDRALFSNGQRSIALHLAEY